MEYIKDLNGKKMTKHDMASAMLRADHKKTPHDYWYYNTKYLCMDIISYPEMAKLYKECFNIN